MSFDFSQLLSWSYYTYMAPGGDFLIGYFLLGFFLVLMFSPALLRNLLPNDKYFRKSTKGRMGKFVAIGVLGCLAVLSRFALVPVFSMRIWLYILFLMGVGFLLWTTVAVFKEYRQRKESAQREKRKKGKM